MENEADWRKLSRRSLNFDQQLIFRDWQLHGFLFCLSLAFLLPAITLNARLARGNGIKLKRLGHNQVRNIK